jgi:1,4-dihydroxy-2-naphthoate octaprenyltransferase
MRPHRRHFLGAVVLCSALHAAAQEAETATSEPEPPKAEAAVVTAPAMRPAVALRAMRPWSFTATVGPVALGAALSFKIDDAFSSPLFALTLITTLAVHAAGNLMNTLVDYTRGVDTVGSSDLTLVRRDLSPRQVGELIIGSYGVAAAAAAPLCAISRAPLPLLLSMLGLGAGSAYVYTGGPGLKYRALGDVLISLTFGPLLVAFAYATQTGTLGWRPLLAALPTTLHIEAILHANNARDVAEDLAAGVRTIAARLGERGACALYAALVFLPYAAPLYAGATRSLVGLLPLVTLPTARRLVADIAAGRMVGLPKRTAKFQFLFGTLFTIGCVLVPSPSLATIAASLVRWLRAPA